MTNTNSTLSSNHGRDSQKTRQGNKDLRKNWIPGTVYTGSFYYN